MPKRKKSNPSVRRDPYMRALESAQKRIEKALIEKAACEIKLTALNQEIPQLQRIIQVLKPETSNGAVPNNRQLVENDTWGKIEIPSIERRLGPKPSDEALSRVPDHLKRFMQPESSTEVLPNNENPDRFLEDVE